MLPDILFPFKDLKKCFILKKLKRNLMNSYNYKVVNWNKFPISGGIFPDILF